MIAGSAVKLYDSLFLVPEGLWRHNPSGAKEGMCNFIGILPYISPPPGYINFEIGFFMNQIIDSRAFNAISLPDGIQFVH